MSKAEIIHYGQIRDGKKIYYRPELYEKQIEQLEGKKFEERIKEKSEKPSKETSGFYRGAIINSCMESSIYEGWTKDEIHAYFASKFLSQIIEKQLPDGHRIEFVKVTSTSDLNQLEMNEFIVKVIDDCAIKGIQILEPWEYNLTKYRTVK